MDPPPPPAAAESIDSPPKRPHSSHDDSRAGGGGKLRLMCSYGGHIIPRPHDKSLCYVGGETRIVVVERSTATVASLFARLSRSLSLNGRSFTLKYQLPNEDLDSLVSVASDEDLDNMIDEYDRIAAACGGGGARIRLFVFFNKPATAASMGSIRSESWFLDSLNSGSPSGSESGFLLMPRNLSDTALVTGIVGDHHQHGHYRSQGHQDSLILVESFTTSAVTEPPPPPSFGSTSPPEMGNNLLNLLQPILVREAGDSGSGNNQEQFQFYRNQQLGSDQIQLDNISITATAPNSFSSSSSSAVPPPPPPAPSITPTGSSENLNRISSEDEEDTRSDHGRSAPVSYRKPPLPLPHQHNNKVVSPVNNSYNPPPSPDSVISESSSIALSMVASSSLAKNNGHNNSGELVKQIETNNNGDHPSSNVISNNTVTASQTPSTHIPIQIQDPFFDQHHQHQQQVHYLKPGPGGGQQMISSSSYYALPPPSPNHHHHQQPYPDQAVYVMPMPMPQHQPPIYPTKHVPPSPSGGKAAEMGSIVYSTNHQQQLYHLHHHQQFHPHQYPGYSHLQHQDAANGGGYEYGVPQSPNDQQHRMFYAQHQGIGTNVMPPTPTPNHHQHQNQHQHHQLGLAASDGLNHNGVAGPHQHQQIEGPSQRLQ